MHGGTQRHEKSFGAVQGRCDVAHAANEKPRPMGSKGRGQSGIQRFRIKRLGRRLPYDSHGTFFGFKI
jgi:hypothetical protein